jgi:hypothetical protein
LIAPFSPPACGRGRGWARSHYRSGRGRGGRGATAGSYDHSTRSLRVVTRDGASLGETLVDEGLAEEWEGYRGSWC